MPHHPTEYSVQIVQKPLVLYRTSFGQDVPQIEAALTSNYEIHREPPHPLDLHATVLHMAVSMFEDAARLVALAKRRPDRLGSHLMTLRIEPEHGVCIADTGSSGHWSVWGIPGQLAAFTADVEEIR